MNLFKLILRLQGYKIEKSIKEIHFVQKLTNNAFQARQRRMRIEQFQYLSQNNDFYRGFVNDKFEFDNVGILLKSHIQRPLKDLLSRDFKLEKVFRNSTSGSSGTPFEFAKNKAAHAMTWALIFNRYSWHGIEYGKSLQARFYGIPANGLPRLKELIKDYFASRRRFSVFDLSDEKLDEFINKFRKTKFEYINGYTSSLVLFAEYCISKGLVLKNICPSLKVCFPTSEMCSDLDRKILENGFGVKIAVEYGCAEMDVLAFEDADGDFVLSNENVFFEVVDDLDNAVPDGTPGRLIVTSLYNRAIPLYRYEIGDIGKISIRKKGNLQILEGLVGRTNEFAILPSGRKVPALTFYYVVKAMIKSKILVKEIVVKQLSKDLFLFEYIADKEFSNEIEKDIRNSLNDYLEPGLNAQFSRVEVIQRTKSGKLKQFTREFK